MFKNFKDVMQRDGLFTLAAGLLIALATFYLIQAAVAYLIAPLITVFIGESPLGLDAFVIESSEFRYGAVIESAIVVLLAATVVYFLPAGHRRWTEDTAMGARECPECTSSISAAAKRCPYCTASLVPVGEA